MNQERAIELALQGKNIFLTGQAGTGKTYTLNKIIEKLMEGKKAVSKTASTGIAATHINGSTIHSWAGIGIKSKLEIDDLYKLKNNPYSRRRIAGTDVLIIDEISMIHDYTLDMIEEVCRFVKDEKRFFGGMQVIVCGDFYQLPPVNKGLKRDSYCFNSPIWKKMEFATCYLTKIYRQQNDLEFIDLLNAIRSGTVNRKHLEILDSLSENKGHLDHGINLYSKNVNVDIENTMELAKVDSEEYIFKMTGKGVDFKVEKMKKNVNVNETILLKEGAKVMIAVNNFEEGFVNGTMGEVIEIYDEEDEETITIKEFKSGHLFTLEPHTWKEEEYDANTKRNKTVASVTQFPLKLAWALTVHKSQGATFDYVNLDLSDVFVENMGYVALSRATSLDGLYLSGYNHRALEIDPIIMKKDEEFQKDSMKYE